MWQKFRKKPVAIEAFQITKSFLADYNNDIDTLVFSQRNWLDGKTNKYLYVKTLEGNMQASLGDWIIKGVKGELYPCKPDIFEMTYELAKESNANKD